MSSASYAEEVANNLAAYLAAHGFGNWDGGRAQDGTPNAVGGPTPILLGPDMPDKPDAVIVLTPTNPTIVHAAVEQGIQIRLRGEVGVSGWVTMGIAQELSDLFNPGGHPRSSFVLGTLPVGKVEAGGPIPLPKDTERRSGATLNLRVTSRRVVR